MVLVLLSIILSFAGCSKAPTDGAFQKSAQLGSVHPISPFVVVSASPKSPAQEEEALTVNGEKASMPLLDTSAGGGGEATAGGDLTIPSTEALTPTPVQLPEHYIENDYNPDLIGFYDIDASGNPREIRNDLTVGPLQGMVQFVQSHSVEPSGNDTDQKNKPTLTAERDALLLFTPKIGTGAITVMATQGGQTQTLKMAVPEDLPQADLLVNQVIYSKRAFSVRLPWALIRPGLFLSFLDGDGRSGQLESNHIEMKPPAELVLQSIRLGMLTPPPQSPHRFLDDPIHGAVEYFQTLPVARLVVAQYEDVQLSKVIVATGTIYTTQSATQGDVYSGDMREDVAKCQVSMGIDKANYGIPVSANNETNNPQTFAQIAIHYAAGLYANGIQAHGLSGGNGMGTLYNSTGNELSHELGHNYTLGHYPGSVLRSDGTTEYFWSNHHADSGWGYIAHRNRMRSNIAPGHRDWGADTGPADFLGLYQYNRDAMSGGFSASTLTDYTHHTGYSARIIQKYLASKLIPAAGNPAYPSGYKKWDFPTGFTDAGGTQLIPTRVGVPVFTVLGGYDPQKISASLLYPPFRGNYGNTFSTLPSPPASGDACWLEVAFSDGTASRKINLATTRIDTTVINQFHINIAQDDHPTTASLICRLNNITTTLGSQSFPTSLSSIRNQAVVVGRDATLPILQSVEIPELEALLSTHPIDISPPDMAKLQFWVNQNPKLLSPPAQATAKNLLDTYANTATVKKWIIKNRNLLRKKDPATRSAFVALLSQLGFSPIDLNGAKPLIGVDPTSTGYNKCIQLKESGDTPSIILGNDALPFRHNLTCGVNSRTNWIQDSRGAIHNQAHPELCLWSNGGWGLPPTVVACDPFDQWQVWEQTLFGMLTIPAFSDHNRSLYFNSFTMYSRVENQETKLQPLAKSDNVLFRYLTGSEIALISDESEGKTPADLVQSINALLMFLNSIPQPSLSEAEKATILSVLDNSPDALSVLAQGVFFRIRYGASIMDLDQWMTAHRTDLDSKDPGTVQELTQRLTELGFYKPNEPLLPQKMKPIQNTKNSNCIQFNPAVAPAAPTVTWVSNAACASTANPQLNWVQDSRGAFHSQASPDFCLWSDGGWYAAPTVKKCSAVDPWQVWFQSDFGLLTIPNFSDNNRGLSSGFSMGPGLVKAADNTVAPLETADTKFAPVAMSANPLLVLLNPDNLASLYRALSK